VINGRTYGATVGVALLLLALALLALHAQALYLRGPFGWTLEQPPTAYALIQGAALALMLLGWLALPQQLGRWPLAGAALTVLSYLRLHHVDLPALAAWASLEVLLLLGALALNRTRGIDARLIAGLGVALSGLLALSLLGLGTARPLAYAWFIAVLALLAWGWRDLLLWRALKVAPTLNRSTRALLALLLAWALLLLARSNGVADYDSLWYGLRSDRVLAPTRSIFDPLALSSPVYYFPKLYELLMLPFTWARDSSFQQAFNVALLVPIALTLKRLLDPAPHALTLALLATLLLATLPAGGNTVLIVKPDLLTVLLLLLGWAQLERLWSDNDLGAALLALSAGALAVSAKLLAIPYVAVLVLFVGWTLFRERARWRAEWRQSQRAAVVALLALLVAIVLMVRTFVLAGVPTIGPEALLKIWGWFGWEIREPVGTLRWTYPQNFADVPRLAYEILIEPSVLHNMVLNWVGSVWLWVLIAAGLLRLKFGVRADAPPWPHRMHLIPIAIALCLLFGVGYHNRGGDGNYVLLALLLVCFWSAVALARVWPVRAPVLKALIGAALALQLSFNAMQCLVSAGYNSPGLPRGWPPEWNDGVFDERARVGDQLRYFGLGEIAHALRNEPPATRAVGIADEMIATRLPIAFEYLPHISYVRPEYFESDAAFARLLRLGHIQYLIAPNPETPVPYGIPQTMLDRVNAAAARGRLVVRDRDYSLYRLTP
jgi:hypothetical protein